jgi:hypothetical protein
MFIRGRETKSTLQASLLTGRRVDGRVRHEQVATFGSCKLPLTIEGRDTFWQRLHQTLARLVNRIDAATSAKIMSDVHKRVPMVTGDERTADAIASAEREEVIWNSMREMLAERAAGMAEMAEASKKSSEAGRKAADAAAARVSAAKDRVERLRRGESVPASKPLDLEKILHNAGFTTADIAHMRTVVALPETALPIISEESRAASRRAEHRIARRLLRQHQEAG